MTTTQEQKDSMLLQEKRTSDTLPLPKVRGAILKAEDALAGLPNAMHGDCFPLEHTFVEGALVRKITIPAGIMMTSKIHKITHPYFVLSGIVDVLTETGVQRIVAPYFGITKAGTKRVLYTHTEVVWYTVHVTDETDMEKIENQIIAKSYEEIGLEVSTKEDICLGEPLQQQLPE